MDSFVASDIVSSDVLLIYFFRPPDAELLDMDVSESESDETLMRLDLLCFLPFALSVFFLRRDARALDESYVLDCHVQKVNHKQTKPTPTLVQKGGNPQELYSYMHGEFLCCNVATFVQQKLSVAKQLFLRCLSSTKGFCAEDHWENIVC